MHYLISLICVLATAAVSAAEVTVDSQSCKQTEHYCDIQSAINAASAGDVVVLASGNYELWQESLTINKSLTLRGQGDAQDTRLLGEGNAPSALITTTDAAENVVIQNLTVHGRVVSGSPTMGPGGLDHKGGDLLLDNVVFHSNRGGWGGAVRVETLFGTVEVQNSLFDGNTGFAGGGIAFYNGSALELLISDTEFRNNNAVFSGGAFLMRDVADATLRNLTVVNNSAGNTGGGGHIFTDTGNTSVVISTSNISGNSAAKVGGVSSFGDEVSISIEHSRLQNNVSRNQELRPDCGGVGISEGAQTTLTQTEPCSIKE